MAREVRLARSVKMLKWDEEFAEWFYIPFVENKNILYNNIK